MKNLLTILILILGIAVLTAFGAFRTFSANCGEVYGNVLRLHIPANSDSDEDQAIKLKLRDLLLEKYGEELAHLSSLLHETKSLHAIPSVIKPLRFLPVSATQRVTMHINIRISHNPILLICFPIQQKRRYPHILGNAFVTIFSYYRTSPALLQE